jgi:peptidase E
MPVVRGKQSLVAGQILAAGGFTLDSGFDDYVLELGGPKVCCVPTATSYPETALVSFYESFAHRAEASHVVFNPWPRADLREHVLSQDVIYVGGGNTANMLAVWRVHGFDSLLREAWEGGALLCGWSAGMICWFEAGVTDSFGPQLEGMRDGLGLLAGSACPHYDGDEQRRPVYHALVDGGFPAGYAADDAAALHFVGSELHEVVAWDARARAYRVEPGGETPLETRVLRI